MQKLRYLLIFILFLCSCKYERKDLSCTVSKWVGKEILYPNNLAFTLWGKDTIETSFLQAPFKIVSYVDSIGCTSCKLKILDWKAYISELNLKFQDNVPVFLIFQSNKTEEITFILKRDKFNYPVYIDENDEFNKLNHFPSDMSFQTFLVDSDNRVVAIGNPVLNPKIKELYFKIIQGKLSKSGEREKIVTEVEVKDKSIFLGKFGWQQEQQAEFVLTNGGVNPLVVDNVTTSCGCTSIDYSKEPVRPGCSVSLNVKYKAEHPEHFDKTITVYCNAKSSPIVLRIIGDAE